MSDSWRKWVPRDMEWIHKPRDFEWRRDPPDIQAANASYDQVNFRVRDDSTALNTDGGWLGTENQELTHSIGTGTANKFRIRFTVDNDNSKVSGPASCVLYAQKNGTGGYTRVTGTRTDVVHTTGTPTDDAVCDSQLLSSPASGSFEGTGRYDDDNSATGWTNGKDNFSEWEHCVYFVDAEVSDGDYFDFRLDNVYSWTYTNEPRVTVSKAVNQTLVVQDCDHSHSVDNTTLSQVHYLEPQDTDHSHSLNSGSLPRRTEHNT